LHQRLTQRFVDRRTALLVRKLKLPEELMTGVSETGEVTVEGERLGRIEGFRFAPETARDEADQRTVLSAALRALRQELPARLEKFAHSPDAAIGIDEKLRLTWGGGAIARLLPGADPLSPKVEPLSSDLLDGPGREAVRKRCADWLEASIRKSLPDLMAAREAELSGAARGVIFQLGEALGAMARAPLEEQIAAMTDADRKALARTGVRLGVYTVFIPTMLKPGAIRTRALLWTIFKGAESIPQLPAEGRTSVVITPEMDRDFLAAVGYLPMGDRAIRADMVERLAWVARNAVRASRDAHRSWQEAPKQTAATTARASASTEGVVTEWMIAAAALGESVDAAVAPTAEATSTPDVPPQPEAITDEAPPPIWTRGSPETGGAIPVAETFSPSSRAWNLATASKSTTAAAAAVPERPSLPPGHFRITPEMLSLIGCGEAEMTIILRALDYRVHQPPDGAEGPTTFSMRPRFQRERDDHRGHDRRGPPPEWKRRRYNDQAPHEGREDRRPRRDRRQDGPPPADGAPAQQPTAGAPAPAGDDRRPPRRDRGPRDDRRDRPEGGAKFGGPQGERRGDGERRFGPRRDRDREAGPEVRLVATTEKKGDRPASDSPFAKLLELKLGKT